MEVAMKDHLSEQTGQNTPHKVDEDVQCRRDNYDPRDRSVCSSPLHQLDHSLEPSLHARERPNSLHGELRILPHRSEGDVSLHILQSR